MESLSEHGHDEAHKDDDISPASFWIILSEDDRSLDLPLEHPLGASPLSLRSFSSGIVVRLVMTIA